MILEGIELDSLAAVRGLTGNVSRAQESLGSGGTGGGRAKRTRQSTAAATAAAACATTTTAAAAGISGYPAGRRSH